MKELSIEQKAKAYDEVIEKLRDFYRDYDTVSGLIDVKEELANLIPELAESEDEKIRKELIKSFNEYLKQSEAAWSKDVKFKYVNVKDAIAWLEKQCSQISANSAKTCKDEQKPIKEHNVCDFCDEKASCVNPCPTKLIEEQKPADKVDPKFNAGDWIVYRENIWKIGNIALENYYELLKTNNEVATRSIKEVDENAHLWTIQDAKDGDVLVASDGSIFLFKCTIDCACKHYIALATDGVVKFNDGLEHYWETSTAVHPATKEQRDTLMKAMADAGYEWDTENRQLREIEPRQEEFTEFEKAVKQVMEEAIECGDTHNLKADADMLLRLVRKPAWSEEDETVLNNLIYALANDRIGNDRDEYISYLKSLKDRVQPQSKQEWSEEDNSMLISIENILIGRGHSFHDKEINWLKSLRPQNTWKPSVFHLECISDAIAIYEKRGINNAIGLKEILEELKKLKN